jgi:predicted nucleic acid-binding protein
MTTKGQAFFDTNVLIYAFASNDPRSATAELLLAQGGVVGVQNLNEFAAVASREMKMPWGDVTQALSAIRALCPSPVPITIKTHEAAIQIVTRHQYPIYDALLIAAAIASSCRILYSEDLQHGQVISGTTVHNPFLSAK